MTLLCNGINNLEFAVLIFHGLALCVSVDFRWIGTDAALI